MEFVQTINPGTAFILIVGCGLLCGVGVILLLGLQIVGSAFGIVVEVVEVFTEILGGGPLAWCGCVVFLIACIACIGIVVILAGILSNCGGPEATNLCSLFGL